MPRKAYMTIDDTPSADTDRLTDYLAARGVPALLYCRGDRLDADSAPAVRAVRKGFILGNHAYAHKKFSALSFAEGVDEIERTERLIDAAYKETGVARPGKYFRFPHIDRGAGGGVVDYDAAPAHRDTLTELFGGGLNIEIASPAPELLEKKARLQEYLRAEGFTSPFSGVTFPWYAETEMAQAVDALYTFSTADWMLSPRHKGKWPHKTLDDLIGRIDGDPWLKDEGSAHIILAHDQDGLFETVSTLTDHFLAQDFRFIPSG